MLIACLKEAFEDFPDHRIDRTKKHQLIDIIGIVICATASGVDGWDDMALYAHHKQDWLRTYFSLENGIPSADTLRRAMTMIDPKLFREKFQYLTHLMFKNGSGELIHIDGKCIRGSKDPLTIVSAWTNSHGGLCLSQVSTEKKSNEITAIPELLRTLHVQGSLITIDAIGCQTNIANQIVNENNADYLLAVKGNQKLLFHALVDFFGSAASDFSVPVETYKTLDQDRGRNEIRRYAVCYEVDWIPLVSKWDGVAMVGMVESEVTFNGKTSIERRYYISSRHLNVRKLAEAVRGHWGIENRLHWVLDVAFHEDATSIQNRIANQNLNIIRKMIMQSMVKMKAAQESYKSMIKQCAWSNDYMLKILLA
jgi:predicted transposase YbfD/YdcC